MGTVNYAVGIPTRDRPDELLRTVRAWEAQSVKPDFIVVVNNNTDGKPVNLPSLSIPLSVVQNKYETPGPEQGHQTAFDIFCERNIPVGVRWDDDLIPHNDFMTHILLEFDQGLNGAIGGCYPRENFPVWDNIYWDNPLPLNHSKAHIQFFEWKYKCHLFGVRSLYSGLVYCVETVLRVGGFPVEYSPIGFRGETDLTLRITQGSMGCYICPLALATHLLAKGGLRYYNSQEQRRMTQEDQKLFEKRMAEYNIDISGSLL